MAFSYNKFKGHFDEFETVEEVHGELTKVICRDYLDENTCQESFRTFKWNCKNYLRTPGAIAGSNAFDLVEKLEGKRDASGQPFLSPGNYTVLRRITKDVHADIADLIDEAARRIKSFQLSMEDRGHEEIVDGDTGTGAKFRKHNDTSVKTVEMVNFFDQKFYFSVGSIDLGDGIIGTGFRVGSKYIMSACHVFQIYFERMLESMVDHVQEDSNRQHNWKQLAQQLAINDIPNTTPEEGIKYCLKMWRDRNPNEFNVSAFLDALGSAGFTDSRKRLEDFLFQKWQPKCVVCFGLNKDDENYKFWLKMDIPYINSNDDVIIAELITSREVEPVSFPNSFRLQKDAKQLRDEMHLIGYPGSHQGHQIIDLRCEVICSDSKKNKACATLREAVAWFKETFPTGTRNFEERYREEVEKHLNDPSSYIMFHSSKSTAHGASGCPGIIDLGSERPVVQAMLQRGCPSFTYQENRAGAYYRGEEIPLQYLFEKGITMAKVHTLLENKVDLRNDLFYSVQ